MTRTNPSSSPWGCHSSRREGSETPEFDENLLKERQSKKPKAPAAPQNKDMELTIQFGPDSNGRNWSGCPVLNKDHKVIGVYSQIPSTGAIGGKPVKTEYGVAWIGRLHEFASRNWSSAFPIHPYSKRFPVFRYGPCSSRPIRSTPIELFA